MAAFGRWKAQRLARADCSRRGALDERAAGVVRLLNGRAPFCTTSSSSGRLVLAEGGAAESAGVPAAIPKKRCRWLLVAHEPCGRADVVRRGAALAAGLRRPGRAGASRGTDGLSSERRPCPDPSLLARRGGCRVAAVPSRS